MPSANTMDILAADTTGVLSADASDILSCPQTHQTNESIQEDLLRNMIQNPDRRKDTRHFKSVQTTAQINSNQAMMCKLCPCPGEPEGPWARFWVP